MFQSLRELDRLKKFNQVFFSPLFGDTSEFIINRFKEDKDFSLSRDLRKFSWNAKISSIDCYLKPVNYSEFNGWFNEGGFSIRINFDIEITKPKHSWGNAAYFGSFSEELETYTMKGDISFINMMEFRNFFRGDTTIDVHQVDTGRKIVAYKKNCR